MNTQIEFGFVESVTVFKQAVAGAKRLLRFTAAGKLGKVTYQKWLEFYTPLCSRGQDVVVG